MMEHIENKDKFNKDLNKDVRLLCVCMTVAFVAVGTGVLVHLNKQEQQIQKQIKEDTEYVENLNLDNLSQQQKDSLIMMVKNSRLRQK